MPCLQQKRANEFAKISVAITAAAKGRPQWVLFCLAIPNSPQSLLSSAGGTDPATNLRLQYTLDRAKQANMPRDNVQTAIKRAEGAAGDLMEQIVYEGRGPGGVAMIVRAVGWFGGVEANRLIVCQVESLTDNRKRTVSQLRHLFAKRGGGQLSPRCGAVRAQIDSHLWPLAGELGATGSVAWMFETKGVCQVELPEGDEDAVDAVMEVAVRGKMPRNSVLANHDARVCVCVCRSSWKLGQRMCRWTRRATLAWQRCCVTPRTCTV